MSKFLDQSNPKSKIISARIGWFISEISPQVFKPDNTLLLVFKQYLKVRWFLKKLDTSHVFPKNTEFQANAYT